MKITLSKIQWEEAGKRAGWIKKADDGIKSDLRSKEKRINVSGRKISEKVWREAEGIARGLYSMNAKDAEAYGFSFDEKSNAINYGEFLYSHEMEMQNLKSKGIDGYIKK